METVYIVEKLITNEAFEQYDHGVVFVTNDITFANNKIKTLIAEEIDAFNTNNDAVGNPETCEILNDTSYVINHNYGGNSQTLIEYEITKWKML